VAVALRHRENTRTCRQSIVLVAGTSGPRRTKICFHRLASLESSSTPRRATTAGMARTPPGSSTVGSHPSDGATTIVTRLARRASRVAIASRRGEKNMRARVVSAHLVVDAANIMAVVVE